jgi:hypothetical protein
MQAQLIASVQHSLSMYLYDNAKFLCERLAAEFPCEVRPAALGTGGSPILSTRENRHRSMRLGAWFPGEDDNLRQVHQPRARPLENP